MKRKVIITLAICFLLVSAISVATYASETKKQQILTEQQENKKTQGEANVNQALMDIIQTFEINQSQYIQIDAIKGLPEFSVGQGFIKDKKKVQSILSEVIGPNLEKVPINSMIPLILISKDGNEVIFGYKQVDGNNVITINKYQDNKWIKGDKKIQKGELILRVE